MIVLLPVLGGCVDDCSDAVVLCSRVPVAVVVRDWEDVCAGAVVLCPLVLAPLPVLDECVDDCSGAVVLWSRVLIAVVVRA